MKKIFLALFLLVNYGVAFSEKINQSDVPQTVKKTFVEKFPAIKNAKWEKEFGNYEAEFEMNGVETSALFSPTGFWIQTETTIALYQMPNVVLEAVNKMMAGKKINEAAKIIDAKNIVTYEVEVKNEDYIFDANGKFLRKEKE